MATKKETKSKTIVQIEEVDKIDAIIESINKNLKDGGGKIMRANQIDGSFLLRIPTNLVGLDVITGGGFPRGGVVQLVGAENSGKTAMAYQVCKNIQEIYGPDARIALLMVEPLDKAFAKNIGFHIGYSSEEVRLVSKSLGRELTDSEEEYLRREIGRVYHVHYPTAEILLQAAYELAASGMFQVIVIDSIAAMESTEAAGKTLDEFTRGGVAKALSSFFKKMSSVNNKTTIIMINQLRDNMDAGLYGKKYTIPGGRALRHASLLTIIFTISEKLKETVGEKEIMYAKQITCTLEKGKAGCHDGSICKLLFNNGELGRKFGWDEAQSLFNEGLYYGIVEKDGNTYSYEANKLAVGKDNAVEALRSMSDHFGRIYSIIMQKNGIRVVTRE